MKYLSVALLALPVTSTVIGWSEGGYHLIALLAFRQLPYPKSFNQ